jgi:hypothetical protein
MLETLKRIPLWGVYTLLAYMPFHIFLSQWLSTATGGLEVWKATKDVLTIGLLLLTVILVIINSHLRKSRTYLILLGLAVLYSLLHLLLYALNKQTDLGVALLASTYNNRLFWYALIAFGAALLAGNKLRPTTVIKLVLIVSTTVCVLGLLQWFLPKDILTHFGYSIDRGVKLNFFINENPDFPRVMATLRDPNSLGAYLLVPIVLLAGLFQKLPKRRQLVGGLLVLHILILFLSFSRAALGGVVIAVAAFLLLTNAQKSKLLFQKFWPYLLAIVVVGCMGIYLMRDVPFVRSVVFRIDDKNPTSQLDSDELHAYFIQESTQDVIDQPQGYGPGTAGIVSIQNNNGSYLTENYYLQIAHEVGILGLLIFLTIWAYVTSKLYRARTLLGYGLVASTFAYILMALVMHLWTNEAVAAQWWLLAGLATGMTYGNSHNKRSKVS